MNKTASLLFAALLALHPFTAEAQKAGPINRLTQFPASGITGTLGTGNGGTGATSLGNCITNSGGVLNLTQPIKPQTGTTYTILSEDNCKEITASNAAIQTYTLPQAGTAGFASGYSFFFQNIGTAPAYIVPTTSTINGKTFIEVAPGQGTQITADVTNNYQVGWGNAVSPSPAYAGATANLVPVCNQAFLNSGGGQGSAGQQTQARWTFYCPKGAINPVLVIPGFWMTGTTETPLVDPFVFHLSIVNNVPAPWNAATTYTVGQSVSWYATRSVASTFANNNIYTAAGTTTPGNPPAPPNTDWNAGAVLAPTALVTCNGGNIDCVFPTVAQSGATVISRGFMTTDPVNITVPVGGYIEVVGWTSQVLLQKTANALYQPFAAGGYWHQSTSLTDVTTTNANSVVVTASSSVINLVGAVVGTPITPTPTVCVVTDSRGLGVESVGGLIGTTLAAGGTSYTSADEGLTLAIPDTNASANEVGRSATVTITAVSGGAVQNFQVADAGMYALTNNGQTAPSGTQTVIGGHGTGFGVTWSNTSSYGLPDAFYAHGYVQQILSESGIPWTGALWTGDTTAEWITKSQQRRAFLAATHCRNVIIQLGINDVRAATSAATIEANLTTMANWFLGQGAQAVFLMPMPPDATSTDGYTLIGNETAESHDAVRVAVNDWERTTPAPFAGFFETATPVESSLDSGLWKIRTGNCGAGGAVTQADVNTCDGLHIGQPGVNTIVSAVGNISNKLY